MWGFKKTKRKNKKALKQNCKTIYIKEAEANIKHQNYFVNVMAEARISNFLIVATDTTTVFKTSTEQICKCIGRWRSKDDEDDDFMKLPEADPVSMFGCSILRLGEILGRLQTENPVAFQSNLQLESILAGLLPLVKDVVKLKRKLFRISDALMPELKNMRNYAEMYGLVTTLANNNNNDGNEDYGNYNIESTTASGLQMLPFTTSEELEKRANSGCSRQIIYFLQNLFLKKEALKPQQRTKRKESSKTHSNAISENMEIKPPSERPSQKHIEQIASTLIATQKTLEPSDYILDLNDDAKPKAIELTKAEENDLWKQLNSTEISPIISEHLNETEVNSMLDTEAEKYFPRKKTTSPALGMIHENGNQNEILDVEGNDNKNCDLDECEQKFDEEIGIPDGSREDSQLNLQLLGESLQIQSKRRHLQWFTSKPLDLSDYMTLIDEMHEDVKDTIADVRGVEISWLNATTRAVGFKKFLKIGDMLDYITKTIQLLDDSTFSEQIYPETRKNVLEAFDPAYREFHSLYIALGELGAIVATDVLYLKELLSNMPKGDPVVYEFTSSDSLRSFDIPSTNLNFDIETMFG